MENLFIHTNIAIITTNINNIAITICKAHFGSWEARTPELWFAYLPSKIFLFYILNRIKVFSMIYLEVDAWCEYLSFVAYLHSLVIIGMSCDASE